MDARNAAPPPPPLWGVFGVEGMDPMTAIVLRLLGDNGVVGDFGVPGSTPLMETCRLMLPERRIANAPPAAGESGSALFPSAVRLARLEFSNDPMDAPSIAVPPPPVLSSS